MTQQSLLEIVGSNDFTEIAAKLTPTELKMKLSDELNKLLSDRFLRKHWDLSIECLMLFQRALELEEALTNSASQPRKPTADANRQPRTPTPYRTELRNLTPPRYLQTSPAISINPEVLLIFGD